MKHKNVTFAGSAASPDQFPRDGLPEVAFLGRSNVGKSSLLNALAGVRGLARVSSDPGRTRLVNFFRVSGAERPGGAGRGDLYLVDLPGYGYVKASRDVRESFERIAVSYLADREPLRLCVFIVDARHEPSDRDQVLRAWLEEHALPYLVAANKIDALSRGEANRRVAALGRGTLSGGQAVLGVSAERGTGVEDLWNAIRGAAFAAPDPGAEAPERRGNDGR
ncbi:MAG TPA: ribosome biogenesis GTP-binding protein YihA/YsxC [Vicinamibacteria bacterium]|nr:ribosome biogenesis GTP-binding protein YihA/YsxC [Vicinamibacteria bacterium]